MNNKMGVLLVQVCGNVTLGGGEGIFVLKSILHLSHFNDRRLQEAILSYQARRVKWDTDIFFKKNG